MLSQNLILVNYDICFSSDDSDLTVNVIPKTTSLLQTDFIRQSDIIYTY